TPNVSVGISDVAAIHETEVLDGIDVAGAAVGRGGGVEGIDGVAVVQGQGQRHFAGGAGRDGAGGEAVPLFVGQQHDVDGVAPDHAGSGGVGELRIVVEAQGL